jgi:hypothetical protein
VALVLAQGAASASLPSSLLTSTAKAAAERTLTAGAVSAQVLTLVEGVMKAMLLSKLKVVCAVVAAVSITAGATGLTYRAAASPPRQAAEARAADDLEELRLEIAALRKGLQTTRDRVKALESEVQALRGQSGGGGGSGDMMPGMPGFPAGPGKMGGPGGGAGGMGQQMHRMQNMMSGMGPGGMPGRPGKAGGMGMPAGPSASSSDQMGAMQRMRGAMGGGMGPYVPDGKPPTADTKPENALPKTNVRARPADDTIAVAETLLRWLKDHPNDHKQLDALERAVRQLKERAQPKTPQGNLQ